MGVAICAWMITEFIFLAFIRLRPTPNFFAIAAGVLPFVLGAICLAILITGRWFLHGVVYIALTHIALYILMLRFTGVPARLEVWLVLSALLCLTITGLVRAAFLRLAAATDYRESAGYRD
jgi:hypothetical protein